MFRQNERPVCQSALSREGPIFLASREVNNKTDHIMSELLQDLKEHVNIHHSIRKVTFLNKFDCKFLSRNEAKTRVIILSGTHGTLHGESALTLKNRSNVHEGYKFFVRDCEKAGVQPSFEPSFNSLPYDPDKIPDIMEIIKWDPAPEGCYYLDPSVCHMTIQVINIAYYYGRQDKFLQDIKRFSPDVIMLAWCFSLNGDVSMLLRREGVFSQMILNNDLRMITANAAAKLNEIQSQIIMKIGLYICYHYI